MKDQKRNDLLKLYIICAIGGSLFDMSLVISPIVKTEAVINSHLFLKDLMYIGLSGLFFVQTPYNQLKLKIFGFMLITWRVIVLAFNLSGLYYPIVIYLLYAIYSLWLVKIHYINPKLCEYTGSDIQTNAVTYNIFIPVNTFRGLLKALFLFWTDPRYETTILVNKQIMYYVKNKMFHYEPKDADKIERFVQNTSARVNIKHLPPKKLKRINNLLYKRAITGVRDCRELEI